MTRTFNISYKCLLTLVLEQDDLFLQSYMIHMMFRNNKNNH